MSREGLPPDLPCEESGGLGLASRARPRDAAPRLAHHADLVRHELPSGRVTFLFTDVEGSTRLLDEIGQDRYATALAEHRRILREAFGAYGGVEVDTQGDALLERETGIEPATFSLEG